MQLEVLTAVVAVIHHLVCLFCFSSSEHDNLAVNVDNCIIEADPTALVPFCFIGSRSGNGETFDVTADNLTVGGVNNFAIERQAVFSLESSIHQLLGHTASATVMGRQQSFNDACGMKWRSRRWATIGIRSGNHFVSDQTHLQKQPLALARTSRPWGLLAILAFVALLVILPASTQQAGH